VMWSLAAQQENALDRLAQKHDALQENALDKLAQKYDAIQQRSTQVDALAQRYQEIMAALVLALDQGDRAESERLVDMMQDCVKEISQVCDWDCMDAQLEAGPFNRKARHMISQEYRSWCRSIGSRGAAQARAHVQLPPSSAKLRGAAGMAVAAPATMLAPDLMRPLRKERDCCGELEAKLWQASNWPSGLESLPNLLGPHGQVWQEPLQ
ncbi:unnamed protein product, partial [Polarella glacialis]